MDILIIGDTLPPFLEHHRSGYFRDFSMQTVSRELPPDHLLIWVLAGGIQATVDGKPFEGTPGQLMWFAPGIAHSYVPPATGHWEWLWVHFGGSGADAVMQEMASFGSNHVIDLETSPFIRSSFLWLIATANQEDDQGGATARRGRAPRWSFWIAARTAPRKHAHGHPELLAAAGPVFLDSRKPGIRDHLVDALTTIRIFTCPATPTRTIFPADSPSCTDFHRAAIVDGTTPSRNFPSCHRQWFPAT